MEGYTFIWIGLALIVAITIWMGIYDKLFGDPGLLFQFYMLLGVIVFVVMLSTWQKP